MASWLRTKKAAAPAAPKGKKGVPPAADDAALEAVDVNPPTGDLAVSIPPGGGGTLDAAALAAAEAALSGSTAGASPSPGTPDAPASPRPALAPASADVEVEGDGGSAVSALVQNAVTAAAAAEEAQAEEETLAAATDPVTDGTEVTAADDDDVEDDIPSIHQARALAVTAASLAVACDAVDAPATPDAASTGDDADRLLAANKTLAADNNALQNKLDALEAAALDRAARVEVEPADLEELTARSERLVDENRALVVARDALETRVARVPMLESEISRLRDEVSGLFRENHGLRTEVDKLNQVASYVGARVAKVLAGARKANAYNAAVATELKRWNRKLEAENARLYTVIDRLQAARESGGDMLSLGWGDSASGGVDATSAVALLRDDGGSLMARLEEQNRTLAREISSLSADAANLQDLSAAVADAAAAAGPRTGGRASGKGAVSHRVAVSDADVTDPRERSARRRTGRRAVHPRLPGRPPRRARLG